MSWARIVAEVVATESPQCLGEWQAPARSAGCGRRTARGGLLALIESRLPIARASSTVRHGNDHNPIGLYAIDDAEGKAAKQVTACSVIESRPRVGQPDDRGFGFIDFVTERGSGRRAAFYVPPRCGDGFFESFVEILKLAGHGRLQRECDVAPPTMESWRRTRNPGDRVARGSPLTRQLPRRDRPLGRGSESAHPPKRRVLRQKGGAPPPAAVWDPSANLATAPTNELDGPPIVSHLSVGLSKKWRARQGSNLQPLAPEANALSNWATGAHEPMANLESGDRVIR